jgi:hypothetical protein
MPADNATPEFPGASEDQMSDYDDLPAGLKSAYPPTTPDSVRRYKTLQNQLHQEELSRISSQNPSRGAMFNNRGISSNQ